jgi:hypothetical protein
VDENTLAGLSTKYINPAALTVMEQCFGASTVTEAGFGPTRLAGKRVLPPHIGFGWKFFPGRQETEEV